MFTDNTYNMWQRKSEQGIRTPACTCCDLTQEPVTA